MRGKHIPAVGLVVSKGLIPACAGKTENPGQGEFSSRLIPACAGKTFTSFGKYRTTPAHPRVCGENRTMGCPSRGTLGSSPRVRGKLTALMFDTIRLRLIPACAGKTRSTRTSAKPNPAHPRVCGENGGFAGDGGGNDGSSPRVRGKRKHPVLDDSGIGLIPACAGKTCRQRRRGPGWRAHPRVCGENERGPAHLVQFDGSSPRVRGKQLSRAAGDVGVGLIPACAGKTCPGSTPATHTTAHPRVCGENWILSAPGPRTRGSSPRVRGKLARG